MTRLGRAAAPAASMPDAARAVARGLAAGLPLHEAFARAADAADPGSAEPLRACARGLGEGEPMATALAPLLDHPGGEVLAAAIDLHHELGGDLVAALQGIAEGLADHERLRLEARALTAQARIAARIVPVAPAAALAVLAALSPSAAIALLADRAGVALLAVSAALTLIALALLRRIARGAGL